MTVPSAEHQYISVQLTRHFANFFDGKPCQIFHAPYGVFLPKKGESIEETTNLVIPDLVVVCDEKKRTSRGCRGAPDLVVEILSPMIPRMVECRGCGTKPRSPRPSSLAHDQLRKLNLYEKKIPEYWIIQPEGIVMVFRLQKDGRYGRPDMYNRNMEISTPLFAGLLIDLENVFPPLPPKGVRESAKTFHRERLIKETIDGKPFRES